MPSYDVHKNPDGTITINGYTFPAGAVPDFASVRRGRRADGLSATPAQTLRRQAAIEAGQHPFGGPLRQPAGQTCGTCLHCVERRYHAQSAHWKCGRLRAYWTKGPGTDLRKRWPACSRWAPGPDAPPDPPPPPSGPDPLAPALDVEGSGLAPALGGQAPPSVVICGVCLKRTMSAIGHSCDGPPDE